MSLLVLFVLSDITVFLRCAFLYRYPLSSDKVMLYVAEGNACCEGTTCFGRHSDAK